MGFLKKLLLIGALALHGGVGHAAGSVDTDTPLEHRVKAAYIFNFARFVTWPAAETASAPVVLSSAPVALSSAPFVIGVMGHDQFSSELDLNLQGQVVEGRALVITRINSISEVDGVNILLVARSPGQAVSDIIAAVRDKSILTVSESPNFIRQGGMIRLGVENNKVRFTVNMRAVRKAGLAISSQMLQYAKIVE